jgi:hypothetical protein
VEVDRCKDVAVLDNNPSLIAMAANAPQDCVERQPAPFPQEARGWKSVEVQIDVM